MPVAELGTSTEALSSQELGRRAHEIMVGLIGSLSASPEFTSAVVKHFFARSFRHHSPQSVSNYGVYFVKGDYGYSVRYSSEPLRYADGGPNMPVDAWMSIYKYDTRIRNERNHPKRVSSVHLSTSFDEDKNKNIWFGTDGEGVCKFDGKKFLRSSLVLPIKRSQPVCHIQ